MNRSGPISPTLASVCRSEFDSGIAQNRSSPWDPLTACRIHINWITGRSFLSKTYLDSTDTSSHFLTALYGISQVAEPGDSSVGSGYSTSDVSQTSHVMHLQCFHIVLRATNGWFFLLDFRLNQLSMRDNQQCCTSASNIAWQTTSIIMCFIVIKVYRP